MSVHQSCRPPGKRVASPRFLPFLLALAALATPSLSLAQAPTFNALVKSGTNSSFNFPQYAAVGDFNGDGKLDALVPDGATSLRLMLGNGDGTFSEHDVATVGTNPGMIQAADLNGDGRLDAICVSNGGNAAATVLINTGNVGGVPQFTATNYNAGFVELRSVTIGDLNGDGRPDFIVGSSHGNVRVFTNNGDGTFTLGQSTSVQPSSGQPSVGPGVIADLNGDGKMDYVVSANQALATNIFFGNGNGTLAAPVILANNNGVGVAVADVNGDNKPDILEVDPGANQLLVYLNNGSGGFNGPTTYATLGNNPFSLTIADVNRDGKPDAVIANFGSSNVAILLGNGNGSFGSPNVYASNSSPYQVFAKDFNGDGVVDIATVGRNDRTFGVLTNTTPAPVIQVFGSGISPVIAWDPIFPATPFARWEDLSTPTQTVGPLPNDARWVNPHPAYVFPYGTHPWEHVPPMNFDAHWINAWSDIISRGVAGQSWTKYSTTVTGEGSFVLQFLADNVSWIYLDGNLVGYQDQDWQHVGTGRYTVSLTGAGPHELVFIIWDGGGDAGGKFRIETLQNFVNNGGTPPPPPTDATPPVIAVPDDIVAEATSANGAAVTFSTSAVDDVDGRVAVVARPDSGSTFPIGQSIVGLSASDAAGNTASNTFKITVQDTVAPALTVPGHVVAEATSANGAKVSYPAATATDAVGVASITYSQDSGAQFALGDTSVRVTASDAAGNISGGAFTVTVQDTIAPTLSVSGDVTAEATSANGAVVSYAAANASDAVGVTSLTYSQASNTQFALGTTAVQVQAKDAAGHTTSGTFNVNVVDTTPPALTVPGNVTAEATSANGAVVSYSAANATDAVGVTSLTYSQASNTQFALGNTTVQVQAKDAAGHTTSGTFTVSVVDTTPPALQLPANQRLEATSAAGAVATFNATATDAVGVTSFTLSQASGSTFPVGTTTVTATAKDAAGHVTTGTFTITVVDTTAPTISSVKPSSATLWPPNHQMVPITIAVAATDNTGYVAKIVGVTSNEPDNGLGDGDTAGDIEITGNLTLNLRAERAGKGDGRIYTITVEARDAYNNVSRSTCTVSVPKSQGK